jgi:hypothetical protein
MAVFLGGCDGGVLQYQQCWGGLAGAVGLHADACMHLVCDSHAGGRLCAAGVCHLKGVVSGSAGTCMLLVLFWPPVTCEWMPCGMGLCDRAAPAWRGPQIVSNCGNSSTGCHQGRVGLAPVVGGCKPAIMRVAWAHAFQHVHTWCVWCGVVARGGVGWGGLHHVSVSAPAAACAPM